MYDVFFYCFDELNADENFEVLKQKAPHAQRVQGIVGIYRGLQYCAQQSKTELFYVIDGDSRIKEDFKFEYKGFGNKTYCWEAIDGVYGYPTAHGRGGLRLYPKNVVLNARGPDGKYLDPSNIISESNEGYEVMDKIATSHLYNTSPLHTWRTIFREYIKQVSKKKKSKGQQRQLEIYLTYGNRDTPGYAWYAKMGAIAADSYYKEHKNFPEKFMIINDYNKLSDLFNVFNYLETKAQLSEERLWDEWKIITSSI